MYAEISELLSWTLKKHRVMVQSDYHLHLPYAIKLEDQERYSEAVCKLQAALQEVCYKASLYDLQNNKNA